MNFKNILGFLSCAALLSYSGIIACGSSGSSSASDSVTVSSLSALPSANSFFSAGSSSSSMSPVFSRSSLRQHAVSGTPPTIDSIGESNVDTLFFNGLASQINDGLPITQEVSNEFFGDLGNCYNFQMNSQNFFFFDAADTALCYMRNMPNVSSGVTVVSGDATTSTIFDQAESTKVVQVNASQMPFDGSPADMTIYLTIYGTNSTEGSTGYAAQIALCSEGSVNSGNWINYNSSTNTLTLSNAQFSGSQTSTIQTIGKLTTENGSLAYDTSQSRSATQYFTGSFSGNAITNTSQVSLDNNVMTALMRNSFESTTNSGSIMSKFIGEFTGSSSDDVAFSQTAFAVNNSNVSNNQEFSFSDTSATEFQDTFYNIVDSNSLFSLVEGYAFTDTIFTTDMAPNSTLQTQFESLSCSPTVDIVVNIDGTNAAVAAQATACESAFGFSDYCQSTVITNAMTLIQMQQQP